MSKPSIPQGMRDFPAAMVRKRNFILNTIQKQFELYGFEPLETPAMENLETLMGKYGEEGDRLIFKVLNNGLNDVKNSEKARTAFEQVLQGKNTKDLTERALKYDLTIPFARYVAMNHGQLTFPYKRYQMQPVWRADRPQKGRYREFTQCDADVVGSKSLINEVELAHIYDAVFSQLGLKEFSILINSRKVLTALALVCGDGSRTAEIATAIDKLDKAGVEKVLVELEQKGFDIDQRSIIQKYLSINGTPNEVLKSLEELVGEFPEGRAGIDELKYISTHCRSLHIRIDPTLARGLDYYTGLIFEVKPPTSVQMGSLGGGGRYDDLTGLFGVPGIPGVGISFGIDRICDVMDELKLFPEDISGNTKAIFFNLGEKESEKAFELVQHLRQSSIACELYHENTKMDKQFKYAEKKGIPFVVLIGSRELETGEAMVKELSTGKQSAVPFARIAHFFQ